MSKTLTDDEFLHKDQQDTNVISPVVNLSDTAGQKTDKAGDNSYDEKTKRVSENLETSSTTKQDKRHKSRKRKRNSLSSSSEIEKRCNKKRRKKSRSSEKKGEGQLPHPKLLYLVHHPAHLLNEKMKQ